MRAVLLLLLSSPALAGVVRAPVELGGLPLSAGASFAPAPPPALPSFLSVANPADAALIARIYHEAQASPTAVAVLAQVAQAVAARGRPVLIEVADVPEGGIYNIDWNVLTMGRHDMEEGPRANVSTLIHELQHMLQTKHDVPSDLLETEVEAYVVDFRVARELGVKPERGSYDARAQAAFKKGLEPFLAFLRKEYPEDAQMHKTRSRDYRARLLSQLEVSSALRDSLSAERAEKARVLERMRTLGHSEPEIRSYHEDSVAPIDAALAVADRVIDWARKDLALFANPEALAKAREYARSVIRRARAYQKAYSRG